MSNDEFAEWLASLSLAIAEMHAIYEASQRIAVAQERIADALERSNLLQEDANKINFTALTMQQQMHNETLANSQHYMSRLQDEREDLKRKNGGAR